MIIFKLSSKVRFGLVKSHDAWLFAENVSADSKAPTRVDTSDYRSPHSLTSSGQPRVFIYGSMDSSDAAGSKEHLLRSSSDFTESVPNSSRTRRARSLNLLRIWTLGNVVLSLALLGSFLYQLWPSSSHINELLKKTSMFFEVRTFPSTIDGGIAAHSKPSVARLPPGPEADAAWARFEKIRTVVISKSDVEMMGKDPMTAARFPDDHWGFGEDAYMGQIDVVHQLHCLNALRKRAFAAACNPEAEEEARAQPKWRWTHLQHCVSILLENLMCHADTELLTMNWIQEADYPFPDFSINKKCRDFETLLNWQAERAVDMDRWMNMTKPSGVTVIPGEKEWFQLFADNETSTSHDH
ncbi:hypothetical protein GGR51DRAFT_571362 [Nemania sp. FL0031]|nr:hypothetical protein GGR51DRAFT_571362 [Nemania sp. FL0031]